MEKITENELKISLDENTAQGIYSNLAIISHSPSEFVTDCALLKTISENMRVRTAKSNCQKTIRTI